MMPLQNLGIFIVIILIGGLLTAAAWFYFCEKQKSEILSLSDYYQQQYRLCAKRYPAKCCLNYIKTLSLQGFRLPEKINGEDSCPAGFHKRENVPLAVCNKNLNLGLALFWCALN